MPDDKSAEDDWFGSTDELPNSRYLHWDFGANQAPISETVYYPNGDVVEWPSVIEENQDE